MGVFIIGITAFLGSLLTFFSGFGLGTILTPVFAVFFPVQIAVAQTSIVHFINNIFKLILVRGYINKKIVISFGIPAATKVLCTPFKAVKLLIHILLLIITLGMGSGLI